MKKSKRAILIHELGLNPKWLYNLINFTINFFKIKVAVVNPSMKKLYKNSFLLPNYYEPESTESVMKVENQVLKIANCNLKKGIKDYIKMAENFPEYNFILLTHKEIMEPDCAEEIKNVPKNFIVEFDQNKKNYLLKSSKYLISLSYAIETFGLILLEAILNDTLPISVDNPGSRYCLNNSEVIVDRDVIINNFKELDLKFSTKYFELLEDLKKYVKKEFSAENIIKYFKELVGC